MAVTLIAAVDRNRAIGKDGSLPWHLPADLRHFKKHTVGKTVLMGRRTFEAIGRPLPDRDNIVLSRSLEQPPAGVRLIRELEALNLGTCEITVIGGGEVYRQLLPSADRLLLTEVDTAVEDADSFFPDWDRSRWRCVSAVARPADEKNPFAIRFEDWERR